MEQNPKKKKKDMLLKDLYPNKILKIDFISS